LRPIASGSYLPAEKSPIALLTTKGDAADLAYGEVLYLHVQTENGNPQRNDVRPIDYRSRELVTTAHTGLLFVPELETALYTTPVSMYPARTFAIDRDEDATNIAGYVDRLSVDVGIAAGTAFGDDNRRLGSRPAFTVGLGFTIKNDLPLALKAGAVVFKDLQDDDLATAAYVGLTIDLLHVLSPGK